MSEKSKISLTLLPLDRRCEVEVGSRLSDALESQGVEIAYPCAGAHLCGRCKVRFEAGAPAPTEEENALLHYREIEDGVRLACCVVLISDAVVRLFSEEARTETILNSGVRSEVVIDPEVKKFCCRLPPSTLERPVSDWSRVIQALPEKRRAEARPTLDVLRKLPEVVARAEKSGNCATLTMRDKRVFDVQCGCHENSHFGVAVDLGTTTIAAALVDMKSGAELGAAGCMNPQRAFGYDLISRIHAVQTDPRNLTIMHDKVIEAIGGLIVQMCGERDIPSAEVCAMSLAGNTAMSHLFLRIDPRSLGQAPFAGTLRAGVRMEARDLNIPIHPHAPVYVLPCMGGFVGGDIVAGILMTKLDQQPGVHVLVDIGTNGEVVVARNGEIYTTSSAAGPSFEGGKIHCGMVAGAGAIHQVRHEDGDLRVETIGGKPPRGVCGSGLIEAFARSLETGLLQMNGRITSRDTADSLPEKLANRLQSPNGKESRILLVPGQHGLGEVYLSQSDVREFQLGKGAVQTAILMALEEVGVGMDKIDSFLVAGAFGNHLNPEDAVAVGLLPDVPLDRFHFVGNSSLEGARCVLLNQYERFRAERIAEKAHFVELATRPEFQDRFAMSMFLGPAMMF
jgi:uncharacterized 2Fe-2S/4Fe-4S cluster protein (DUF4445 family)